MTLRAYNFVHGLKSRVREFEKSKDTVAARVSGEAEELSIMRTWHKHEMTGLAGRLRCLRVFPNFFTQPPPNSEFVDVDVTPILEGLRHTTAGCDERYVRMKNGKPPSYRDTVWRDGPTEMLLAFVNTHTSSLRQKGAPIPRTTLKSAGKKQPIMSSWSGITGCIGIHLHSVLGLWNDKEPIERRLHYHVLRLVKHDLDRDMDILEQLSRDQRNMWLWKAMTAAVTLKVRDALIGPEYRHDADRRMIELQHFYEQCLCRYSHVTGYTQWSDVRSELTRICWTKYPTNATLVELTWTTAMSYT